MAGERDDEAGTHPGPRRILVTGSSGYLGAALVERLRHLGHEVVGLDLLPGPATDLCGSVADREFVRAAVLGRRVDAVVHTAALHKPHVATHHPEAFLATNVEGTRHLLEAALASGSQVRQFVFTSTTSLMISAELRAGKGGGRTRAAWMTESFAPLAPRNIYGVTKLAAEQLCAEIHRAHGLPITILRTSRFFPEDDDMAHTIAQSEPNTKANELLFRRLSLADAVESHVVALRRGAELGLDTFIVSARTPFHEDDCAALIDDAPAVVARYFPEYPQIYARLGWSMFASIDRVYVSTRAEQVLGFHPRDSFAAKLRELADPAWPG